MGSVQALLSGHIGKFDRLGFQNTLTRDLHRQMGALADFVLEQRPFGVEGTMNNFPIVPVAQRKIFVTEVVIKFSLAQSPVPQRKQVQQI